MLLLSEKNLHQSFEIAELTKSVTDLKCEYEKACSAIESLNSRLVSQTTEIEMQRNCSLFVEDINIDLIQVQNIQLADLQSKYDVCAGMLTDCQTELIEANNKCFDQQKRIDKCVGGITSLRAEIDNQRNISALQVLRLFDFFIIIAMF